MTLRLSYNGVRRHSGSPLVRVPQRGDWGGYTIRTAGIAPQPDLWMRMCETGEKRRESCEQAVHLAVDN